LERNLAKFWPKFAKFSKKNEQKIKLCSIFRKMLHFGKIPKKIDHNLAKIDFKIQQNPDNF
jgi:hypothetical protein